MSAITVSHLTRRLQATIQLPSSKSESNRALIIRALSNNAAVLHNLSSARDTQTLIRLLASTDATLDVLDAGTTMRFLTAFCAVTNRKAILTGTARMCQRPIGILVEALRTLGADIAYMGQEGFPPLQINGFRQQTSQVSIRADVSSQFITALLLVSPYLPQGLQLTLTGAKSSYPYIQMTLDLMAHFGLQATVSDTAIAVAPQNYAANTYTVESDWSAASYWFSVVALADEATVLLPHLREASLQGDKAITDIMRPLGVASHFTPDGLLLTKTTAARHFAYNFTDCPDLAQTVAVVCAAKGIQAALSGLHSLRVKETDRLAALVNELGAAGAKAEAVGDDQLHITAPVAQRAVSFKTYDDHRMAMAFAPLGLLMPVSFDDAHVVAKSYPHFWEDLRQAGFTTA